MMTAAQRMRATFAFKPVDHLVRSELFFWPDTLERWKREGLPDDYEAQNLFHFDPPGIVDFGAELGETEVPVFPPFEWKVLEDNEETQVVSTEYGRIQRIFKRPGHGYMPEFIRYPVSCERDWEETMLPRLNPSEPSRYYHFDAFEKRIRPYIEQGAMIRQGFIGGFMFLRSLMGPENLFLAFYEQPGLIHRMMAQWAALMRMAFGLIQRRVTLDVLLMSEDICYRKGLLVSPEIFNEFLRPYYREVLGRARWRQALLSLRNPWKHTPRRLHISVDTDGFAEPAVPLYRALGCDEMHPWEVASGCDVVAAARKWPRLVMMGGIDKRVLADGKDAIDRHLRAILPPMRARGGYIPTCDHGVPPDVSLDNYLHYRNRICELDSA